MAIQNYGELKTAIANWLNRADLTAYIPDLIALGEQRINYGGDGQFPSTPLRIPAMQTRVSGTITSSTISFPTRFLEAIRIAGSSGSVNWSLEYCPPERFSEKSAGGGLPTVYTILNNSIQTAGTADASYVLDYYQAFAPLTADLDTNWVLANAPGLYLYSALLESSPFLGDNPVLGQWHAMFQSSIYAVNRSTKYHAAGSLVTRVVK